MMKKKAIYVIKILVLGFFIYRVFSSFGFVVSEALNYPLGSFDFQWDSAKLFSMRMNPYLETLFHIYPNGNMYEKYYGPITCNQFPSMICLLLPYTLFDPITAKFAWLISNGVFIVCISIGLSMTVFKGKPLLDKLIWNIMWIGSVPLFITIGNGQHLLFSFSGFIFSIAICEKAEKVLSGNDHKNNVLWIVAGILLGISYFKYTVTAVTVLYFIYRKWWKPIFVSLGMHAILTIFSAYWIDSDIIEMFRDSLMISAKTGEAGYIDMMTLFGNGIVYKIIVILMALLMFYFSFTLKNKDENAFLSLLISVSLIIVYHRSYDYFVMIVPAFWLFDHMIRNRRKMCKYELLLIILLLTGIWIVFFDKAVIYHFIKLNDELWEKIRYVFSVIGSYLSVLYMIYYEFSSGNTEVDANPHQSAGHAG
ncbi:MAG: glycosyltransferase 87 family protein [Lachnospiraceae bacterium]|nr:glycosyltransferase 87 family protein [Lachnospiraceae bacterium]